MNIGSNWSGLPSPDMMNLPKRFVAQERGEGHISDEEWDTEDWYTKRHVSILQEADIEDFFRYRGVDLHKLKFKVQPKNDKQATSLETINLVPHRFLLIKPE